jgi:hypothetical protein
MIIYEKEELYGMFKDAVDQYFQLQRDYEFLKKKYDALVLENKTLKLKHEESEI